MRILKKNFGVLRAGRLAATAILASLAAGCFAQAGWTFTFSGGSASPNGQLSAPTTNPFTANAHSSWGTSTATGPTSCECKFSGTAPNAVFVEITEYASWYGGAGGNANDGYSDPHQGTEYGWYETGSHWAAPIQGGTTDFTVNIPEATASAPPPPPGPPGPPGPPAPPQAGLVAITVTINVYPVDLNVGGVADTKGDILIGQQFTAGVASSLAGPGDTYNWSITGGNPFQSYNIVLSPDSPETNDPDSANVTWFSGGTGASITTHFQYPEEYTVQCVYHCAAAGSDVTVHYAGAARSPFTTWGASLAYPGYEAAGGYQVGLPGFTCAPANPTGTPSGISMGDFNPATEAPYDPPADQGSQYLGILFEGSVTTPSSFNASGNGTWNQVQLADPDRQWGDTAVDYNYGLFDSRYGGFWANGETGLDTSFPFECSPGVYSDLTQGSDFPADGSSQYSDDSPTSNFLSTSVYPDWTTQNAAWISASDGFETFTLYHPPGVGSQYVALESITWNWQCLGYLVNWVVDQSSAQWGFNQNFPPQPTWNYRVDGYFQTELPEG